MSASSKDPKDLDYDVFCSHNWGKDSKGRDNHERVCKVNTSLKDAGFVTWCDVDEMKYGIDTLQAMTSGIERSKIVLVFVTKNYMAKVGREFDNCKLEFDCAYINKKMMIPVVMEKECFDVKTAWYGNVKSVLGTKLYLDFSEDSKFDDFMKNLKEALAEKIKKISNPNAAHPSVPTPSMPPAPVSSATGTNSCPQNQQIDSAHAYFLMLQPSSAPLSSYLKLTIEFDRIKKSIDRDNDKLAITLRGGTYEDRPIALAKVLILCANGIDEDVLCGNDTYIRTIVNMKPEVVLLCLTHGAKRIAERLSHAGVKTVCWMRVNMCHVDLQDLFEDILLPFCKDLLLDHKPIATALQDRVVDKFEYGSIPEHPSQSADASMGPTLDNLQSCVKVKMTELGSNKLFGFDWEELGDAVYQPCFLSSICDIKEKIKTRQQSGLSRNSPQFINVKMETAASSEILHNLMNHICVSLVEEIEDENLKVKSVYRIAPKSKSTPSAAIDKDELFAMIGGERDMVVYIDGMKSLFPQVKDLVDWLVQFKKTGVTFIFPQTNNEGIDEYIDALHDKDLHRINIWSNPALRCDLTGQQIRPTPYQATIRVFYANISSKSSLEPHEINELKNAAADLAGSASSRIDIFIADDGSIIVQVSLGNIAQLKRFFHAVIDKEECRVSSETQDPVLGDIKFSIEDAMDLYQDAALKLNTLNDEQIKFLEKIWRHKDRVHLGGAAGTGKTFIALHCVLEYLKPNTEPRSSSEKHVLLVCPNLALCCAFTRWLLVRIEQNDDKREKLLGKIKFLIHDDVNCEAVEINVNRKGDLEVDKISIANYAAFGLIVVDESQAVFDSDAQKLPSSLIDLLYNNKRDVHRKLLLLSDASQARCIESEISFPPVDDTFQLKIVSRCSANITAATIPYQLGEKSECEHGIRGPRVKVHLFDFDGNLPKGVNGSLPNALINDYASRLGHIVQDISSGFKEGVKNLHKRIAITVPDETFREQLLQTDLFRKLKMKPVTALDAMIGSGMGNAELNWRPWIIIDTPSKVNGLEFSFVILTAQDSVIKEDDPKSCKDVQSCIYRAMSRGQYIVHILNHSFDEESWFDWLKLVDDRPKSAPSKSEEVITEFNKMRDLVDGDNLKRLVSESKSSQQGRFESLTQLFSVRKKMKLSKKKNASSVTSRFRVKLWYDAFDTSACNKGNYRHPSEMKFAPSNILVAAAAVQYDAFPYDAFLTLNYGYDKDGRDNWQRVAKFNQALKTRGVQTWFDEDQMSGDMFHRSARGIEQSMTVIVFITKKYIEKVNSDGNDNCKFEFHHALNHRTVQNMIPVVMEDLPTPWAGPVGLRLGNHLYYNFKSDDELHQCVDGVRRRILEMRNQS